MDLSASWAARLHNAASAAATLSPFPAESDDLRRYAELEKAEDEALNLLIEEGEGEIQGVGRRRERRHDMA